MSQLIAAEDQQFIIRAAEYLENPSFLVRLSNSLGQPLEVFTRLLPEKVHDAVEKALRKVMEVAARTVTAISEPDSDIDMQEAEQAAQRSGRRHAVAMAATGAASGFFGLAALPFELPVSTTLLFRSIARTASEFGEDLSDPATRLECLSVLSYGSPAKEEVVAGTSYLTTRLGLAVFVEQAAQILTRTTAGEVASMLARGGAPAMVHLIAMIANRFTPVVAEKLVAQGMPVVGAVGGGVVNTLFAEHFNSVARYHFGLRKLERQYGVKLVQQLYREGVQQVRTRLLPGPA